MNSWRRSRQYVADFVNWVGMGRVVATSVGVAIVAVGAWWIMRMPPPPIELSIPFAASTTVNSVNSSSSSQTVTSSTIPLTILVDVAGEVIHPGVVVIAGGSRVIDALNAAGGPTSRADLDVVNLAAALVDGAQVYVPKHGETTKRAVTRPIPGVNLPPQSIGSSTPGQAVTEPVDLNSATEQQLDTLPGVGPSTARAIITYRLQHGPFARVEDLLNVRGIGPAKFEALLGLVRV